MAGTFLEHRFTPRWVNQRQKHEAPHAHSEESHGHLGLDVLARFLHAFNVHQEGDGGSQTEGKVHPLFDLIESPDDYKIYGELPGLASEDIQMDLNDHLFTINVSGKFEVPVEIATLQGKQDDIAITHKNISGPGIKVEEIKDNLGELVSKPEVKEDIEPTAATDAPANSEPVAEASVSTADPDKVPTEEEATGAGKEEIKEEKLSIKYHIHERKLGTFKRAFQFPVEGVKMEDVTAQCKNGLLTITVPKNPTPVERKIRKVDVV